MLHKHFFLFFQNHDYLTSHIVQFLMSLRYLNFLFQHEPVRKQINLYPKSFNESFHTHVQINLKKGNLDEHNRFIPTPKYNERDIMTEGSGFLQWLSVYTFALSPKIDILLLDEPDAHLHCS